MHFKKVSPLILLLKHFAASLEHQFMYSSLNIYSFSIVIVKVKELYFVSIQQEGI